MGYRSNVGAAIYPRDTSNTAAQRKDKYEALRMLMATRFKSVVDAFGGCEEWVDNALTLQFYIEDVKWYEGYEDVGTFMQFLKDVVDLGYEYEFVRIGEEDDDVERQCSDCSGYTLSVSRQIVFN